MNRDYICVRRIVSNTIKHYENSIRDGLPERFILPAEAEVLLIEQRQLVLNNSVLSINESTSSDIEEIQQNDLAPIIERASINTNIVRIRIRNYHTTFNDFDPTEVGDTESSLYKGCPICKHDFEMGAKYIQMSCGHQYHDKCLFNCFNVNTKCPTCRSNCSKCWLKRY